MAKDFAILAEWAWTQGLLGSKESRLSFCALYLLHLSKRFRNSRSNAPRAIEELNRDLERTLKILTYGGRRSRDANPERVAHLTRRIQNIPDIQDFGVSSLLHLV